MNSNGWEVVTLGDIAEIIMGQSPAGETCNEKKTGTPLLNGPTEFGDFHPTPVQYTTDPKKFSNAGDILFCVRGSTTGKMNWADQQYAIGRGIAAIRHKNGKDFQPYLKGVLDYYLPILLTEATGSTFPNVSSQQLIQLPIEIPPLSSQHRIADIFSALDDKIELNRQTNATLDVIAQSIFIEWFVEFNFPGATGEMVESELGMIPKGWKVGRLEEIISNFDSKRIPVSSMEREKRKGIYPYYGAASIVDYIDDFLFDGVYLLMGEDGTVITDDEKPVLQYVAGKFWVNNHTHVLQGKGIFSTEFIYLILKNTNIKHIVTGAVQPKINQGNMNNLPVVVPDTETLKAFQEVIKPTFAYILETEQQSSSLMSLRDTLLPKLMNGEIEA